MKDIDWDRAGAELDAYGCAVLPALLDAGQCAAYAAAYARPDMFRSRVVMERHGFGGGDVVIGVCGPGFKCPPAPHETALLLHDALTARGLRERSSIRVVIPMPVPLPPSPELSAAVLARYAERGIEFIGGHRVVALERTPDGARTEAVLHDGTRLPFDLFLGIPVHKAPPVVAASGLAENGWIPVDKGTAATRFPDVYAVGDVTSVGTPGRVVPIRRWGAAASAASGHSIDARYHVLGTRIARCMSLATRAIVAAMKSVIAPT